MLSRPSAEKYVLYPLLDFNREKNRIQPAFGDLYFDDLMTLKFTIDHKRLTFIQNTFNISMFDNFTW